MSTQKRLLCTEKDTVNATIFWFEFNGRIYGVRWHNGSEAVIDLHHFPIEDHLQGLFLAVLTITDEMKRLA